MANPRRDACPLSPVKKNHKKMAAKRGGLCRFFLPPSSPKFLDPLLSRSGESAGSGRKLRKGGHEGLVLKIFLW